jgi:hypothetical protein
MTQTKWYRELAGEQYENGSWGPFHGGLIDKVKKQKFKCTEIALRRAWELSLPKDDPMIAKTVALMERYLRGDEMWIDRIEKHDDKGKGHLFCRPFMTAAYLNTVAPENPLIKPLREVVAETLKTSFASGYYDEDYWVQKEKEYHVPGISAPDNGYSVMLLRNADCMDDTFQRNYLNYIWNGDKEIYYFSSMPPADKRRLEDKQFPEWLGALELLSYYSLFGEFMKNGALSHLLGEANRLINGDVNLSNIKYGRFADSWRDKNKQKTDMILRIARILVKC